MAKEYLNADIEKIYTTQDFPLGAITYDENDREFVFCKYNDGDGNNAAVAGYVAVGLDSAYPQFEVTCDLDSATIPALRNRPIGAAAAAFTNGTYGWFQRKGKTRFAMLTDGNVTQGQVLFPAAATVGCVNGGNGPANATNVALGVALEADTSTALAIGYAILDFPEL